MRDINYFLTVLFDGTRYCQTVLQDGAETASGAALRNMLNFTLEEVDLLESEIRHLASSFGLEFDHLPPISHLYDQGKNRLKLHFHSTDSDVAEILISSCTKVMICLLRTKNQCDKLHLRAEYLSQRFLGCLTAAIRNLQDYL